MVGNPIAQAIVINNQLTDPTDATTVHEARMRMMPKQKHPSMSQDYVEEDETDVMSITEHKTDAIDRHH